MAVASMPGNGVPLIDELTGVIVEYPYLFMKSNTDGQKPNSNYINFDAGHRHFSSMHWYYPGTFHPNKIHYTEMRNAAQRTLKMKSKDGGGHTSWSATWEACLYSRLGDSESAWGSITKVLKRYSAGNMMSLHPSLEKVGAEGCSTCFRDPSLAMDMTRAEVPPAPDRGLVTIDESKVNKIHKLSSNHHCICNSLPCV